MDERARLTDRGNSLNEMECGAASPFGAGRCELPPHDVGVLHRASGRDDTGVWKLEWYDRQLLRDLLASEARKAEQAAE